ncbi:hypothetical protein H5V45_08095 [Nocardioides sp. KIGAM211]|uniref:J domain-containing protein n=1 Tax=Nocardioides luti TaxID=2761101 RepID=A0A7X0VA73_9ACTN|nr:hypothetical protein [Nocardioides luti]MBB6627281.1 hypothetical protein [Nocardioides luti]
MTPSWYDLLDVAPDASEAEIRAAWKAAIADLDPSDRRFRLYNQAAETLLDPQRRAAHDEALAADAAEDEPEAAVEESPVVAAAPATVATTDDAQGDEARDVTPGPVADEATGSRTRRTVPAWLLATLAMLTALTLAACVYVLVERPSDAAVEDSTRAAQAAAERAIGPILSYDALHLDEDQQAAHSYMTSAYRKDYDKLFEVIKQNAPATKTIVKADVVRSGIVRSGEDRVEVLLFVNRPTTNKQVTEPVVYKDQVTVTMQKVDGDWLVADLQTSPVGQ